MLVSQTIKKNKNGNTFPFDTPDGGKGLADNCAPERLE